MLTPILCPNSTVFSITTHELTVDGKKFELTLWDTAGQVDYKWLGPASYQKADVVLICFSIDSPTSLANVELKWAKKIKHFCKNAPIILVGNKIDLCTDQEIIKRLQHTLSMMSQGKTQGKTPETPLGVFQRGISLGHH